jgi:hypothetical protein
MMALPSVKLKIPEMVESIVMKGGENDKFGQKG